MGPGRQAQTQARVADGSAQGPKTKPVTLLATHPQPRLESSVLPPETHANQRAGLCANKALFTTEWRSLTGRWVLASPPPRASPQPQGSSEATKRSKARAPGLLK